MCGKIWKFHTISNWPKLRHVRCWNFGKLEVHYAQLCFFILISQTYDLWGDAITLAARMAYLAQNNSILMTEVAHSIFCINLVKSMRRSLPENIFKMEPQHVEVKGRGKTIAFQLEAMPDVELGEAFYCDGPTINVRNLGTCKFLNKFRKYLPHKL